MTQNGIIAFLLLYIVIRESLFMYNTHKFINKIMSTSFYEYRQASNLIPTQEAKKQRPDVDVPEDLGVLEAFNDNGMM